MGLAACGSDPTEGDSSRAAESGAKGEFVVQPYVQSVDQTTACFHWRSRSAKSATVTLTTAAGDSARQQTIPGTMTQGATCLDGLAPGTTYHYEVHLVDAAGGAGASSVPLEFQTAKVRYEAMSFAFIADTQTLDSAHRIFIKPLNSLPLDLIINGGDLVGSGAPDFVPEAVSGPQDKPSLFLKYATIVQQYGNRVPVFPVVGNHDYDDDDVDAPLGLTLSDPLK